MATRKDAIDYTPALGEAICEHVAAGGSVKKFCAIAGNPSKSAVFRWLMQYPEFAEHYTLAQEWKGEAYADETVDLADGNGDVQKVRNQISSRQWMAERLRPKRYGNKVGVAVEGELGLKVEVLRFSDPPASE